MPRVRGDCSGGVYLFVFELCLSELVLELCLSELVLELCLSECSE